MDKAKITLLAGLVALAETVSSCKSQAAKDAEAKTKIEAYLAPGAMVEVDGGVATLSGTFPDEASRIEAEAAAKKVEGVKTVIDRSRVPPPVVISPDRELTEAVNSAIALYPGVQATVQDGVITLTGTLSRAELPDLMQTLNALNPESVENNLEVH